MQVTYIKEGFMNIWAKEKSDNCPGGEAATSVVVVVVVSVPKFFSYVFMYTSYWFSFFKQVKQITDAATKKMLSGVNAFEANAQLLGVACFVAFGWRLASV